MSKINKTYVFETVLISGTTGTTVEYITGATFNTADGDLLFETVSGNTISIPMDGRYSLTGHTHNISEITNFIDNSSNWDLSHNNTITGMTFNASDGVLTLNTLSGNTITENLDGRYLTGFTETSNTNDYVTGSTFNTSTGLLEFVRVSGGTFNVNLDDRYAFSSGHTHSISDLIDYTPIDDYVTGGTFNTVDGVLEFIRQSGDTFNINIDGRYAYASGHTHSMSEITDFPTDISSFNNDVGYLTSYTDSNEYITGATFNTSNGNLTLTTLSGNTIIENLDGRYLTGFTETFNTDDYTIGATLSGDTLEFNRLSGGTYSVVLSGLTGATQAGPIIFSAETSGTTTWVGYGELNACKIREIKTLSGPTYTAFWSNGEEDLNKVWANRYYYSYF